MPSAMIGVLSRLDSLKVGHAATEKITGGKSWGP